MRIIISPAKKMNVDTDSFAVEALPQFLANAERLKEAMQAMSDRELQALWKCNNAIAKLNVERLRDMDLRQNLTPAILSYEGIQYQYMAPGVMEAGQLEYLREHLRILSGFYGLLRPFDGVTPYRLEMQAKLSVDGAKDLYTFWGRRLAKQLAAGTDWVLNLASKEYSRAVEPHLPPSVRFLTCTFGEWKDGKVIEKGTMCKMARGQMVRWLAENQIEKAEDIRELSDLEHRFEPELSDKDHFVFTVVIGISKDSAASHQQAIGEHQCLRFDYARFDLDGCQKIQKSYRHIRPIQVIWEQEHYYLVALNPEHEETDQQRNYRIDRIKNIAPDTGKWRNVSTCQLSYGQFDMFSAKEKLVVTFRLHRDLLDMVFEMFGTGIVCRQDYNNSDWIVFSTEVELSAGFDRWILRQTDKIEVLEPPSVRSHIQNILQKILESYCN